MAQATMKQIEAAIAAPGKASAWAGNIARWTDLYSCKRKKVTITLFDGEHTRRVRTTNMGKRVCEDWASLTWTENAGVDAGEEGGVLSDFLEDNFGEAFAPTFAGFVERVYAQSTGALEVLIDDIMVSESGAVDTAGATYRVSEVPAECVIPMKWNGNEVTEAAFASFDASGVDVRMHIATPGGHAIINRRFEHPKAQSSKELIEVDPLPGVAPYIELEGFPRMFHVFRPGIENNIDPSSPFGISVLANAEDALDLVDLFFDNLGNDVDLGGKMVFMSESLLKHDPNIVDPVTGKAKPIAPQKSKASLFVAVDSGLGDDDIIKEHNPDLRVADNTAGLATALSVLSSSVGMGAERYVYREGSVTTATQVISENSDLFRTRRRHLLGFSSGLIVIVRAMLYCAVRLGGLAIDPDVELTVRGDDSVIEDDSTRIDRGLRLLQAQAISQRTFLIDYMQMTEDDADAEVERMGVKAASLF